MVPGGIPCSLAPPRQATLRPWPVTPTTNERRLFLNPRTRCQLPTVPPSVLYVFYMYFQMFRYDRYDMIACDPCKLNLLSIHGEDFVIEIATRERCEWHTFPPCGSQVVKKRPSSTTRLRWTSRERCRKRDLDREKYVADSCRSLVILLLLPAWSLGATPTHPSNPRQRFPSPLEDFAAATSSSKWTKR